MKMKNKLDKYEQSIENSILEYRPIAASKYKRVQAIIRKAQEKKNISLRVNKQDLDLLKLRAEQEGIPYQTLLLSIIHMFVTGQLLDQRTILKSIVLLKSAV